MTTPSSDMARDVTHEVMKAVPPVTVLALTLNEWLALASIIYVVLQAVYLIRKWAREERRRVSDDT